MPELRLNRTEDSPLLALHLSCPRALLCPAGVCALRFSSTTDGVARNALLKTLPRAVILKRFATALRVLLRATGFGIRRES